MDYFQLGRNELIELQPSLQKLTTVEMPMNEAYQVVNLIDRVNPCLKDEKIMEIKSEKITMTLLHNVRMTPLDVKLLSKIIDFKEEK